MPRPTTKEQLLAEARKEFSALEKMLAALTPTQMTQTISPGQWSIKDTLAHLAEWMNMFFTWHTSGLRGESPTLPAPGFKWNQLPALNQKIYTQYRDMPLDEVLTLWRSLHHRTLQLVESLSQDEIFVSGSFAWTAKHSLATFINANTASHYRWARGEIRKKLA